VDLSRAPRSRPARTKVDIEQLIVRMATDNPGWRYTRIQGALTNLNIRVACGTIRRILRDHLIEPAPSRGRRVSWSTFLKPHWRGLAASDFFTVEVWSWRGLLTFYVLFIIDLSTRRVTVCGVTTNPNDVWMLQVSRNLIDVESGALRDKRFLIVDRGYPDRSGPSWLTFFAQAKDSLWSVDLFRCESILLHGHWVLVAMDVFTRRIIGFGIGGEYIDGPSVCRMLNQAIAGHAPPVRIITDHDPLFRFHRWLANLRVLEVEEEIKSVPHASMSHPFVERLIGTIRREYLDHTFFWNSIDLHRKLGAFRTLGVETPVAA
jgi:transposase InsO family protein